MFLADYHMHTTHSDDAHDTMHDMAIAASKKGIKQLCFTDHADECCDTSCLSIPPNLFMTQEGMYEEYESVRDELKDIIDIRFGAELAAINHSPDIARSFSSDKRLDFIIGSIHNVRGLDDFFFMDYESEEQCHAILSDYLAEYAEVVQIGCCDVLGHIGYPQKYMFRNGFTADVCDFPDELRGLLKLCVQNGIGIEVNTSGMRGKLERTIPDERVLRLYRECGGEIITVGSDSHNVADSGRDVAEAYELLRTCGFKYVSTFSKRKVDFIAI